MKAQQAVVKWDRYFNEKHPYNNEIQSLIESTQRVNRIARDMFEEAKENDGVSLEVEQKSDAYAEFGYEDVLTKVDKVSEKTILSALKDCRDIHITSEETETDDNRAREAALPEGAYRWLVDPIDGTFCVKHGIPDFSITIALQKKVNGKWHTELGAVSIPMHDEVYLADQNDAYLIQDNRAKKLSINGQEQAAFSGQTRQSVFQDKEIEVAFFKSKSPSWMQARQGIVDALGDSETHTFSTAMRMAKMADNWVDGVILGGNALDYAWDLDAAIHIVQNAGAKIKRFELDGDPVVLLANSQSLLTAMEQTVREEYHKVMNLGRQVS